MQGSPSGIGSFLFFLALMALLSIMDAIARRQRQRQQEQMEDEPQAAPAEREAAAPVSWEEESDWAYLQRSAEGPEEEDKEDEEVREPAAVAKHPVPEEPLRRPVNGVPRDPTEEAAPPLLLAAAEEIRKRSRRYVIVVPVTPPLHPTGAPAPIGAPRSPWPRKPRIDRLRTAFHADPGAARKAVVYREILGQPLGSRPRPGGWEEPD